MPALDDLLRRAYRARCQGSEPETKVIADFKAALADPAFSEAARARLAAISDERILTKDFVSRVFHDFLTKGLE